MFSPSIPSLVPPSSQMHEWTSIKLSNDIVTQSYRLIGQILAFQFASIYSKLLGIYPLLICIWHVDSLSRYTFSVLDGFKTSPLTRFYAFDRRELNQSGAITVLFQADAKITMTKKNINFRRIRMVQHTDDYIDWNVKHVVYIEVEGSLYLYCKNYTRFNSSLYLVLFSSFLFFGM